MEKTQKTGGVGRLWDKLCSWQKAFSKKITPKSFCILLCVVLLLSLIPILYCGHFSYPVTDDYRYGAPTRQAWLETGNILMVLKAAVQQAKDVYHSWQGSYTGIFLMGLQPGIWGEHAYAVTPYIIIGSLLLGIFSFCFAALRRLLRANVWAAATLGALLSFICIQLVPHPFQSIYWYNGSIYYAFYFALSLMQYAAVIVFCTAKTKTGGTLSLIFATLVAIFIAGGNYITAAATLFVNVFCFAFYFAKNKKRSLWLLLPILLCALAFAVSLLAPGNTMRQTLNAEGLSFFKSIVYCLYNLVLGINAWVSFPFLVWFSVAIPVFWRVADPAKQTFRFGLPLAVTVGSLLFLAACMFPHLYAVGTVGPYRLYNMFFFMFTVIFAANLLYWIGWLRQKLAYAAPAAKANPARPDRVQAFFATHAFGLLLLVGMVSAIFMLAAREDVTTMAALQAMRSGELRAYAQQMDAWEDILKDETIADAQLPLIESLPYLLVEDPGVGKNPEGWVNVAVAEYYGKDTVRLAEGPAQVDGQQPAEQTTSMHASEKPYAAPTYKQCGVGKGVILKRRILYL